MSLNTISTNFADLPPEVIAYILDFLPPCDLRDAQLVCKQWLQASLLTYCVKNEVLVLKDTQNNIAEVLTCERKFKYLRVRGCLANTTVKENEIIWSNMEFWSKFGPNLHCLSIEGIPLNVKEEHFFRILSYCSGLQSLKIGYFFELQRDRPVDLSELYLPNLRNFEPPVAEFDGSFYDNIVKRAPKLEVVELDFVLDMLDDLSALVTYIEDNPKLTFVLKITNESGFYDAAESGTFKKVLQMPNVRVQEYTSQIGSSINELIFQYNVKSVTLGNATNKDLHYLCNNLKELEYLCLSSPNTITSSLLSLHLLENLTTLDIRLFKKVTNRTILMSLGAKENKKLKVLKLYVACPLSGKCIVEIMRSNPSLRRLDLLKADENIPDFLTDLSVQAIFQYQESLEELYLEESFKLTDAGLSGMVEWRDPTESASPNRTTHSMLQLKRLRVLRMVKLWNITGSSFKRYLKFPALQCAFFSSVPKLTKLGVQSLIRNNRTLETLTLDHTCEDKRTPQSRFKFRFDGIAQLITNLWRLKYLHLSGLRNWTEQDVDVIKQRFGTSLFYYIEGSEGEWNRRGGFD